jgi:hypothetical protein
VSAQIVEAAHRFRPDKKQAYLAELEAAVREWHPDMPEQEVRAMARRHRELFRSAAKAIRSLPKIDESAGSAS